MRFLASLIIRFIASTAHPHSYSSASWPSFEATGAPLLNAIDTLAYGAFVSNWAQGVP